MTDKYINDKLIESYKQNTIFIQELLKINIDINSLSEKELLYLIAKDKYYNTAFPIMDDTSFDVLEESLKLNHSRVINIVGNINDSAEIQCPHYSKMLSLRKEHVWDNSNIPYNTIAKIIGYPLIKKEVSPKFDGNAFNLQYKDKKLIRALSRTDKDFGTDRYEKVKYLVPNEIDIDGEVEIRCEILIKKELFAKKYAKYNADGKMTNNERNYVAGIMGRHDVDISVIKELNVVAYDLRIYSDVYGTYQTWIYPDNTMDILFRNNFEKVELKYYTTEQEFIDIYNFYVDYKKNICPYRLDGIVIKLPENLRLVVGETIKYPNFGLAIKFPPEENTTRIDKIKMNTGTSDELTPTLHLDPIVIDGSTVKQTSGFNYGKLLENGWGIGAEIIMVKSGDIIPYVFKTVKQSFVFPDFSKCPECQSPTRIDGIHLLCTNDDCSGRKYDNIEYGIRAFGIKTIGPATIKDLYKCGIKSIFDYFNKAKFNKIEILKYGIFKDGKELDNIISTIQNFNNPQLWQVIQSLGITDLGETMSKQLAKYYSKVSYDFKGLQKNIIEAFTNKNSNEFKKLMIFLTILNDNGINVVFEKPLPTNVIIYEMTGDPFVVKDLKTKGDYEKLLKNYNYIKGKEKDCTLMITQDYSYSSGKVDYAKKNSKRITLISYEDILKQLKYI